MSDKTPRGPKHPGDDPEDRVSDQETLFSITAAGAAGLTFVVARARPRDLLTFRSMTHIEIAAS